MLKLCNLMMIFFVFYLQKVALENGLILVDTKYEFGKTPDGTIVLIDEVILLT
jgi:phosphoribosylaminoimidazole-succinocarboxamide synthase